MMHVKSFARLVVLCAAVAGFSSAALAQEDTSELEKILKSNPEGVNVDPSAMEPGDKAEFSAATDDDISRLDVGATYSNNGSIFKVVGVPSKSTKGGKFRVSRIEGKNDPGLRWKRVGGEGPMNIRGTQSLLDLYIAGGPFLHPIAILAVVMIVLAANSFYIYRLRRQAPPAFIDGAIARLDDGDIEGLEKLAAKERGLLATICRSLTDRFDTSSPQDIKARAEITAAAAVSRLRWPIKALNLIAAAAPLLGLLGTIIGMVIVFEAIGTSSDANKAQALATGIRVKLFSTASALMVAIPSLFLYFIFNQKLTSIIGECELLTEQFLHRVLRLKRAAKVRRVSAGALRRKAAPAPVAEGYDGGLADEQADAETDDAADEQAIDDDADDAAPPARRIPKGGR